MIIGIGCDLTELERIREAMTRFGPAFPERILTEAERKAFAESAVPAVFLAGRWAAKEAVSKALGCGLGHDCALQDVEILNSVSGAPEAVLSGHARKRAEAMGIRKIHVSISHERSCAMAFAVAED